MRGGFENPRKILLMRARVLQFFRSAISLLPTLAILGVLAALAIVGHFSKWKITEASKLWSAGASADRPVDTPQNGDKQLISEPSGLRFQSVEAMHKSGIQTARVAKRPMSQAVVAHGIIDYDRTRMAQLSTRAPGTVWKVYRRVGEPVRRGEVLGLVDAAEVGRAKAEFLQAIRALQLKTDNLERQRRGSAEGAVPERALREGEAAVAEARIRLFSAQQALTNLGLPIRMDQVSTFPDERLTSYLRFLGLPESITQALDQLSTTANLLPQVAPFDGVVIRSDVVEGEVVSSASPQYIVADLSHLWVMLDARQEDIAKLRKGQAMVFQPDGAPELEATGTVSWISTEVDDKTRTVRVRAEVQNDNGQLRARSFGTGRIVVAFEPDAVAVPSAALQWKGSEPLVFVQRSDEVTFQPRHVRLGLREGGYTHIVDGVLPGEVVATNGSHMLSSQLFLNENRDKEAEK
jgi:cobalt-zinc-cadmium efflux system membrane fusion protein